jgi:hypothetical protein
MKSCMQLTSNLKFAWTLSRTAVCVVVLYTPSASSASYDGSVFHSVGLKTSLKLCTLLSVCPLMAWSYDVGKV